MTRTTDVGVQGLLVGFLLTVIPRNAAAVSAGAVLAGAATQQLLEQLTKELLSRNRKDEINKDLAESIKKFEEQSVMSSGANTAELKKVIADLTKTQGDYVRDATEIKVIPDRGSILGNIFEPPGVKIQTIPKTSGSEPDSQSLAAYAYPAGVGNLLTNNCFDDVGDESDPCSVAMVLQPNCQKMLDGAGYMGVGFDGRGDYSSSSRKKSIIQRTCLRGGKYGDKSIPDTITAHGVYDTNVKSMAFSSAKQYQSYLQRKAAVAQSHYMFQEATSKAYGSVSAGFLGAWGAGGSSSSFGKSSQSRTSSSSSSSSYERSQTNNHQTYMSLLEVNVIRYELFLDEVTFNDLNIDFLKDFISLPVTYANDPQKFQNFVLRWGTHYVKSAEFGGQLKFAMTKQTEKEESLEEFSRRAHTDHQAMFSTYSARSQQFRSSSWLHSASLTNENSQSSASGNTNSKATASQDTFKEARQQEYSNEVLMVEGGDHHIAAVIADLYTMGFKHDLVEWLQSIPSYPKPFNFQLAPVTELCQTDYTVLFPVGYKDMGCLGMNELQEDTDRTKFYEVQSNTYDENNTTRTQTKRRYCYYSSPKDFEEALRRRCNSLQQAISSYLEEGPVPSTDIELPAGEEGCETVLTEAWNKQSGVLPWEKVTDGSPFQVTFDTFVDIQEVAGKQDKLVMLYQQSTQKWFVRTAGRYHLYDGWNNDGSGNVSAHKISVRGLLLDYDNRTGLLTLTSGNFDSSKKTIPGLSEKLRGLTVARVDDLSRLHDIEEHREHFGMGGVPCNVVWSNAHRINPLDGDGKCVSFTAVSQGDIFMVFSAVPADRSTWYYVQISRGGVAIYKGSRVMRFVDDPQACSLGDPTLFDSYFICMQQSADKSNLTLIYGKPADNGKVGNVYAVYEDTEAPIHVRFYAFGNGEDDVTVVNAQVTPLENTGTHVCLGETVAVEGRCIENCHSECDGCHRSDSATTCRACRNKMLDGACVAECPGLYRNDTGSNSCICKTMEEGECVEECNSMRTPSLSSTGTYFCLCKTFVIGKEDECLVSCPSGTHPFTQQGQNVCTGNVRLAGGTAMSNGRVEVLLEDESWGTVCSDNWNKRDAAVVCRQLGYCGDSVQTNSHFGPGSVKIHLNNVRCTGGELNLLNCGNDRLPFTCGSGNVAGVVCQPCDIRLAGHSYRNATAGHGRVEVKIDGVWGTVCGVNWDSNDATVLCRQLGYCHGFPNSFASYGQGSGPIHLSNVGCSGIEQNLLHCPMDDIGDNHCMHSRDAGVSCKFGTPCIRLVNGVAPTNGRVEVYGSGGWGTICDSGWDNKDAQVVCRQLGFCKGTATVGAHFGRGTIGAPVHFSQVGCRGTEQSIFQCLSSVNCLRKSRKVQYSLWLYRTEYYLSCMCTHTRAAGVMCTKCPT